MIRVLVVDDSAFNRVTLTRMLESSDSVRVVGTGTNGEDAIKQVVRLKPDIITLDLEMPVMDGYAFLRWLMANKPTPVIVVSSRASDKSVFKALELGAVDFIAKPGGRVSPRLEEIQRDLLSKVVQCGTIQIENVRNRIREEETASTGPNRVMIDAPRAVDLVVIGCSTGGPPALQTLFQTVDLLPVPFVVAQHMPPVFTKFFAERVNRLTSYTVKEGEDGEPLLPGVVYVAPGGLQAEVAKTEDGLRISITERVQSELYAPSVNRLFRSAAEACGKRLIAVVMTGMGDDGSAAIPMVRKSGGRTIAEAASTAIIFGMPGEAIKTGAIEEVLPLNEIGPAISRLCTTV